MVKAAPTEPRRSTRSSNGINTSKLYNDMVPWKFLRPQRRVSGSKKNDDNLYECGEEVQVAIQPSKAKACKEQKSKPCRATDGCTRHNKKSTKLIKTRSSARLASKKKVVETTDAVLLLARLLKAVKKTKEALIGVEDIAEKLREAEELKESPSLSSDEDFCSQDGDHDDDDDQQAQDDEDEENGEAADVVEVECNNHQSFQLHGTIQDDGDGCEEEDVTVRISPLPRAARRSLRVITSSDDASDGLIPFTYNRGSSMDSEVSLPSPTTLCRDPERLQTLWNRTTQ